MNSTWPTYGPQLISKEVIMSVITKTPKETKHELKRLGFSHATGLQWLEEKHNRQGEIQAPFNAPGRWVCDERWTFAFLNNGEVWIVQGKPNPEIRDLLRRICPKGRYCQSFLPDGWKIDSDHMGSRYRDPYSDTFGDPLPI